jgi:SPRY domain.
MKSYSKTRRIIFVIIFIMISCITNNLKIDAATTGGGVYLNPSSVYPQSHVGYLSENNFRFTADSTATSPVGNVQANTRVSSGKWYWEVEMINYPSASLLPNCGIIGDQASKVIVFYSNGLYNCGTTSTYGTQINSGDIISILLDADNGKLEFLKNGVSQGVITIDKTTWGNTFCPFIQLIVPNADIRVNFGATSFKYSSKIPSGYLPYSFSEKIQLAATLVNNSSVNLNWNTIGGATSYNIKKSTTPGVESIIGNVYSTTSNDVTVDPGNTYYYVVTALFNGVESIVSNEVSITIDKGNSTILELTMTNGEHKEYDMTATEIADFLTWYDARSGGASKAYYVITKKDNIKPFLSRKEYIVFDKISSFEVKEYSDN